MKKGLIFLTSIIVLLIAAAWPAQAVTTNTVSQIITVPTAQTIDDNYVRFGNEITIDGTINGDVIVAGNTITINGKVAGDVLVAATTVEINGPVDGNVRVVGQNVRISGSVGKNLNIAANTATIADTASVGWTLSFAANSLAVNGPVGGSVYGFGGLIKINTTVGKNVTLKLGDNSRAVLQPKAVVNGNFDYTSPTVATIESGAVVKGNTSHQLLPQEISNYKKVLSMSWIYFRLIGLFGLLLVGTIVVSVFSKTVQSATTEIWSQPGRTMLTGLLILIVVPIACFILLITIVGIPLAMIGLALYGCLLYCSQVIIGTLIGQKLMQYFSRGTAPKPEEQRTPLIWAMMFGTTVFTLLTLVPYIGPLISLAGILWALGALWVIAVRQRRQVQ